MIRLVPFLFFLSSFNLWSSLYFPIEQGYISEWICRFKQTYPPYKIHPACENSKWHTNFSNSFLTCNNQLGQLPIHWAIYGEQYEIAKWMAQKNPEILFYETIDYPENALFIALRCCGIQSIKWMVELAPNLINTKDSWGQTILHYASRAGDLDFVQKIYAMNPNLLRRKDQSGLLPLHQAFFQCQEHVVFWMLEQDPNLLYEEDLEGNYPLHLANYNKCGTHLAINLIDFDPRQLYLHDAEGITPIGKAIENRNLSVIKHIISYDPSFLKEPSADGTTVFHIAAELGTLPYMIELLELERSLKRK